MKKMSVSFAGYTGTSGEKFNGVIIDIENVVDDKGEVKDE
jgi:hypothetical protein